MIVTISEQEILNRPNHYDLGEYIHKQYIEMKQGLKKGRPKNENLTIHNCKIYGEDFLRDKDIESNPNMGEKDKCVICGQESPYTRNTHIDHRIGYIQGGGQGCFKPKICDRN